MRELRLGGPHARRRREDTLRDGALVVTSPRGLARDVEFLVESLPAHDPGRSLFGMDAEAAAAMAASVLWPGAEPCWFHMDAYVADRAAATLADNDVRGVRVEVAADLPRGPFDLVALPFPASSDHQLMWDLLEAAHDALAPGGRLVAATDGKPDALRDAVKKVFRNVTPGRFGRRGGASFYATRKRVDPVLTDRAHVVRAVIRPADGGPETTLDIETRPGTFAYRRLDPGTRALAEAWAPAGERAVLDLGAGCGALGIHAALRLPEAHVTLVDSNARAIGCAERSAAAAGLADRVTAVVRTDLENLPEAPGGGYDLVLANPPYFGDFRIARSFSGAARAALRPGGRALMVARTGGAGTALREILDDVFGGAATVERNGYDIVSAARR